MRTFLSQEATARCSEMGEKARSEMLSSGGAVRVTSFDMSPVVLFGAEVPVEGLVEPKRPDIVR